MVSIPGRRQSLVWSVGKGIGSVGQGVFPGSISLRSSVILPIIVNFVSCLVGNFLSQLHSGLRESDARALIDLPALLSSTCWML